jgi:2-oxoglutarate dehydrogenase E2 component (dihydrolipoamide succinyltransferase)
MSTDVVMPQMGESIAEGTIVRWIKNLGDVVERDEPLFEISTDKVDAEIPSPVAGVVVEIRAKEGETVPVNSVVAVIGPASAQPGPVGPAPTGFDRSVASARPTEGPVAPAADRRGAAQAPEPSQRAVSAPTKAPPETASLGRRTAEEVVRQRSSPLVRKIAEEHHVDISQIRGTGIKGRVTRDDILAFVGRTPTPVGSAGPAIDSAAAARSDASLAPATAAGAGLAGQTAPMSVMRRKIAEHMMASRRTSAHVHSVFEVNFGRIDQVRQAKKAAFEGAGAKLTYLAFIVSAVAQALRAMPVLNASVQDENIVYHKPINIGIAVALDWGLIVPVVKNADEKDLLGISRAIADLAGRARSKQLKPEEVSGGTFTVTNPGAFGALFGMPIINQPQVAILGVGAVEKRPVVVDDAIAIRPMAYLTLGFDHRIIDGAVADTFMAHVKHTLESWDPSGV